MKKYCKQSFWLSLLLSIGLIVGSFFVPPMGVIDGSVLAAVGELFAFAALGALIHAIDGNVNARVSHGDTTLEINPEEPHAALEGRTYEA